MMHLTIKWRLSLISMATLSGILLLFTLFVYFSLSHWMLYQQERTIIQEADHVALAYPNHIEQGSGLGNDANPNWLDQFISAGQTIAIYKQNGAVLKIRQLSAWNPPLSISSIHHLLSQSPTVLSVQHHEYVRVVVPSRSDKGGVLSWIVLVGSIDMISSYLTRLVQILLIGSFIGILLTGVSGYYLGIFALQPISKIIRSIRSMDIYQMNERLAIPVHQDEIAELSMTFNALLDRLSQAVQKQNEFVANASHEFRSPLAVIEGYINLLARWGKEDLVVTERAIIAIKKEADRLRRLTNSLLQLAGVHNQPTPLNVINVVPIIKEMVDQLREIYQRDIDFQAKHDVMELNMHAEHLHQIMAIIIQNAVKYTLRDKTIQVNLVVQSHQAVMEVIDEGVGISETSLPHIFNRFYRGDQERNRTTEGFGLGLAIAKELVESNGGTIEVNSQVSQGTKVILKFPLA